MVRSTGHFDLNGAHWSEQSQRSLLIKAMGRDNDRGDPVFYCSPPNWPRPLLKLTPLNLSDLNGKSMVLLHIKVTFKGNYTSTACVKGGWGNGKGTGWGELCVSS